ncbi:MAG: hypothetical protein LBI01_04300 [Elusimicrobium sp.]|jgi:hypothetical protein|nr:hypothetical protein [Elusimicrobium sp.]
MHKKLIITTLVLSVFLPLRAQSFLDELKSYEEKRNKDITEPVRQVYAEHCGGADSQDCINALNNDDSAFKAFDRGYVELPLLLLENDFSLKARGSGNENFLDMLAVFAHKYPEGKKNYYALLDKTKKLTDEDVYALITSQDNRKMNAFHTAVMYAPYNKKVKNLSNISPKETFLWTMAASTIYYDKTKTAVCEALTQTDNAGRTPFHTAMDRDNKEAFFILYYAVLGANCDKQKILDAVSRQDEKGMSVMDEASRRAAGQKNNDNSFYADILDNVITMHEDEQLAYNKKHEKELQKAKELGEDQAKEAVASAAESAGITNLLPTEIKALQINTMPPQHIDKERMSRIMQIAKNNLAAQTAAQTPAEEAAAQNIIAENPLPPAQVMTNAADSVSVPAAAQITNMPADSVKTVATDTVSVTNKTMYAQTQKPANKPPVTRRPVVTRPPAAAPKTSDRPVVVKQIAKPQTAAVSARPSAAKYKTVAAAAKAAANKYAYLKWLESSGGKSTFDKARRDLAFRDFEQAQKDLAETAKAQGVSTEKAKEYVNRNVQQDYFIAQLGKKENNIINFPEAQILTAAIKIKPAAQTANKTPEKRPAVVKQEQVMASTETSVKKDAKPAETKHETAQAKTNAPASDAGTVKWGASDVPSFLFEQTAELQHSIAVAAEKQKRETEIRDSLLNDPKTQRMIRRLTEKREQIDEQIASSNKTETRKEAAVVPAPSANEQDGALVSLFKKLGTMTGLYKEPKRFVGIGEIYGQENSDILQDKAKEIIKVHNYASAARLPGLPNNEDELRQKWKGKEQRMIDEYITFVKQLNRPEGYRMALDLVGENIQSTVSNLKPWDVPPYTDEADSVTVTKTNATAKIK